MIENDRWYKRLGWFIFYFLIMLLIFFIIDLFVQKYIIHYNEAGIEASYEKEVYEFYQDEDIILNINTNARKFTVDIWIDETETPFVFQNTKELKFNFKDAGIEVMPAGTYHIKSTVSGKRPFVRQTEVLIETDIVIKER